MKNRQLIGCGVGFRPEHAAVILEEKPDVKWFEILIDNHMDDNASKAVIDQLVEDYPVTFHGVGLSIGSVAPLDLEYLKNLKQLKKRWQPAQISDHFSWTGNNQYRFHELLPLTATRETISHLTDRIARVQDFIGEQIILENASTYVNAPAEMTEWDFINEVCAASGCGLLLDINNVHVNAFNHGFKIDDYLNSIGLSFVKEIHLAGFEDFGDYYFDSHSQPVSEKVWESYAKVINKIPEIPSLVEWDNNLPDLDVLIAEATTAESIRQAVINNNPSKLTSNIQPNKYKTESIAV